VIDFRYHLVSIIAVFLALAVGLVVGATALAPTTEALLKTAQHELSKTNASLTKGNRDLRNQVNGDQSFAQAAAPLLLHGLLAGQKVVVVSASSADQPVVNGVTSALRQAGATVTGEVILNPPFLATDGRDEAQLTQVAQSLTARADVTLPAQSSSSIAGQQAASRVLAASLLTADGAGLPAVDTTAILKLFSQDGYVSMGNGASSVSAPATLAVLVAPGGAPPQTGRNVFVALAVALRNAGAGTVMVSGSESVGSHSVIEAEIKAGQVSTVDYADTETGQIMTVQALKLLLADNKSPGQYGIDPDGPNAAPSPAPTPSVTPTSTPSPGTSSGGHK
jgi:Copper transport outer membrane protein, MctB